MRNLVQRVLIGSLVLAPLAFSAPSADAVVTEYKNVAAFAAGNPANAPRVGCASETWGGVAYAGGAGCPSSMSWEIALPNANQNTTYAPVFHVQQSATNQIMCASVGSDAGTTHFGTAVVGTASTGVNLTISPGAITVPANGYLFVACNMTAGSVLSFVSY